MNLQQQKLRLEKIILSYGYADTRYTDIIISSLNSEHFSPQVQSTFKYLKKYYEKYNAIVTSEYVNNLFTMGKIKADGHVNFNITHAALGNYPIKDTADLKSHIDLLREQIVKEKTVILLEKFANKQPQANEVVEDMKKIIEFHNYQYMQKNVFVDVHDVDNRINGYLASDMSDNLISSGFKSIDEAIGGFKRKELIYVIGRKGAGKSVLLFNLGYNAWKDEQNVLFITLEIDKDDYSRRIDSYITKIPALTLKTKTLNEAEQMILKLKMNTIKENRDENGLQHTSVMHIVESNANINVNAIKQIVREQEERRKVRYDVIVVDYASLLQPTLLYREDRLKHGQIAFELKNFARDNDYLIISAAQMNRAGEGEGIVTSGNVANSDSIADHLDYGIAIVVEKDPMIKTGRILSFKTRDGSPFNFTIMKNYDILRIEECEDNTLNWTEDIKQ
jgi:replicative DNA helicase